MPLKRLVVHYRPRKPLWSIEPNNRQIRKNTGLEKHLPRNPQERSDSRYHHGRRREQRFHGARFFWSNWDQLLCDNSPISRHPNICGHTAPQLALTCWRNTIHTHQAKWDATRFDRSRRPVLCSTKVNSFIHLLSGPTECKISQQWWLGACVVIGAYRSTVELLEESKHAVGCSCFWCTWCELDSLSGLDGQWKNMNLQRGTEEWRSEGLQTELPI